jgi:hypothetical protein
VRLAWLHRPSLVVVLKATGLFNLCGCWIHGWAFEGHTKIFFAGLSPFLTLEAAWFLAFRKAFIFHRKKDYSSVFDFSDAFAQNRNFLDEPEKTS